MFDAYPLENEYEMDQYEQLFCSFKEGQTFYGGTSGNVQDSAAPNQCGDELDYADGKDRKGRTVKQLTVTFPAALHGGGQTRAYDYEVVAETEECDVKRVVRTKRVYSPAYFLSSEREPATVNCVFSLAELNTRKGSYFSPTVRFAVRAVETFGKASAPLVSRWFCI